MVELIPPSPAGLVRQPPQTRGIGAILWHLVTASNAHPLAPPAVPPDLMDLPPVARVHACVRLYLADIEYAMSPGGHLRGLVHLTCRIAVVLGIILLCAAGVLALASLVLSVALVVAGQLVLLLERLLQAALLLVALLAIAFGLLLAVRVAARQGPRR